MPFDGDEIGDEVSLISSNEESSSSDNEGPAEQAEGRG